MISFNCKQCGKRHSRPDSEGGAMVFCDCGNGLRVPFSSSAIPDLPDAPEARPLRFPSSAPPPPMPLPARPVPVPVGEARESVPLPPSDDPLPYRKQDRRYRKVDRAYCWHHEETASAETCGACHLPFCADCLVALGKQVVCGPCKNFRVAQVGQPTRTLPLAAAALVAALVAGPVAFVLSAAGVGLHRNEGSTGGGVLLALLAMLLAGGAMAASIVALRRVEAQTRLGGRAMATSGLCVSMASVVWAATVLVVIAGRHMGG